MDLAVGQVYGEKYRIVRLLGSGSMGAVYEGENIRIRRKVAIKTLHPGMAEKGDTLQRFEREAQAAGRIGSKHIVEVLDMGDLPDGSRYMVMEHLEGITLQQHIRTSGRVRPMEASAILQQLLEGLGAAHAAGIIHRDLKPANVFLVRQPGRPDFVKILDFGVSKFSVLSEEMSMTRTGAVLGTPYYMSPEQAKGSRGTDQRSDLYAVGVILYECITGQVPFSAETFNELLFRIVLESPPPAESFVPDLSPELAAIIRRSMAREPTDRYQTAEELKKALAEWSAKAEEAESPNFDGLATLDHKTVMREPPGLRPAPPSTTAQGTIIVGAGPAPGPAAKPGLAALGTVIIDPAVGSPAAAPNGAPAAARAPANGAGKGSLATQPLPQWTDGAAPPGAPVGAMGAVPAPPPVPGYAADARGAYPMASAAAAAPFVASPVGEPYPDRPPPAMTEVAPRGKDRPGSAMRTVAFLGIVTGLLAGVAAWAVFWRGGDDAAGSGAAAAEVTGSGSATAPSAAASASSAASAATSTDTASGAPSSTSSAAASATASSAPTSEPTSTGAPPTDDPVLAGGSGGKSPSKGSTSVPSKPTASGAASSAPAKGGKTNPSSGRTVSRDL